MNRILRPEVYKKSRKIKASTKTSRLHNGYSHAIDSLITSSSWNLSQQQETKSFSWTGVSHDDELNRKSNNYDSATAEASAVSFSGNIFPNTKRINGPQ